MTNPKEEIKKYENLKIELENSFLHPIEYPFEKICEKYHNTKFLHHSKKQYTTLLDTILLNNRSLLESDTNRQIIKKYQLKSNKSGIFFEILTITKHHDPKLTLSLINHIINTHPIKNLWYDINTLEHGNQTLTQFYETQLNKTDHAILISYPNMDIINNIKHALREIELKIKLSNNN